MLEQATSTHGPAPLHTRAPSVVHVITTLGTGGAERHVEQLVTGYSGEVTVVCLYEKGLVADAIEAAGIPVVTLGMDGLSKLTASLRLAALLRRLRPDVVNVHLLSAQLWGIPAARLAGVPVVVSTEHSLMDTTIEGRPHTGWLRLAYRVLERLSHHTVAVSDTARVRLERWGVPAGRISVIDNAIDFDAASFDSRHRSEGRRALQLPAGSSVIGAIGRLEPIKRFEILIDAAVPLLRGRDTYLVILGEGGQRRFLEERAAQLGISDRLRLPGARPDSKALLSAFDVFASPSRDETFGIAILEAVANGLPVVYGNCPALEDLGDDGDHRQRVPVGPRETADFTRGIERALRHPTRTSVPSSIRDRYDPGRVTAAYRQLYANLVESTGSQSASWARRRLKDPAGGGS